MSGITPEGTARTRRRCSKAVRSCIAALLLLFSVSALAVPSFSRQTGRPCSGCHTVYPELTPYGREFKLGGFTAGDQLAKEPALLRLPLSVSGVLSETSTRKTGDAPEDFEHDRQVILQEASVYYAGRIAGNFGALVQYKYSAADFKWGTEMAELRFANETTLGGEEHQLIYGLTTNNNPSLADIYNSSPMWSFPHMGSDVAVMPNAAAIVDNVLASQVGGIGAYARWNELIYAEVDVYRKATGLLHPFSSGTRITSVLDGYAPYWRLALQYESSPHSFEVGTFGMDAKVFPDPARTSGPSDHFADFAIDSQYQYLQGSHSVSVHATYIHERQDWNASFPAGMSSNQTSALKTSRADVHYFYRHKMGGGVQYFATSGTANEIRYNSGDAVNGSLSGRPNTSGWNALLTYLPIENVQLGVQYTAYDRFDGGRANYSGSGRAASDNNTLYIYLWVLY